MLRFKTRIHSLSVYHGQNSPLELKKKKKKKIADLPAKNGMKLLTHASGSSAIVQVDTAIERF